MVSSYWSVSSAVVGASRGPNRARRASPCSSRRSASAVPVVGPAVPVVGGPSEPSVTRDSVRAPPAMMESVSETGAPNVTPAGGTAVAERPLEEVVPDVPWVTIVWDDPVNLMSYVAHVFTTYFHYAKAKAERLMMQVHTEGKAVVSSGSREAMERDVTTMHEYGLWATLDKVDGGGAGGPREEVRPRARRPDARAEPVRGGAARLAGPPGGRARLRRRAGRLRRARHGLEPVRRARRGPAG